MAQVFVATGCFILFIIGTWWGQEFVVVPAHEGGVTVARSSSDLGVVMESDAIQCRVRLDNRTSRRVQIAAVSLPRNRGTVYPESCSLDPREHADIFLTLSLRSSDFQRTFERQEIIPIVLLQPLNPPARAQKLYARVRRPLLFSSQSIEFSTLIYAKSSSPKFIDCTAIVPLERLIPSYDQNLAEVLVDSGTGDGNRFVIGVTPSPDLPVGRHESIVELVAVDTAGKVFPEARLPVHINVVPDVTCSPSAVNFGVVKIGSRHEVKILVYSQTQTEFEVKTVESSQPEFSVSKVPPSIATTRTLDLVVEPTKIGAQKGCVRIHLKRSDGVFETALVMANYHGQRLAAP
jgi:hypothetical protein